MGRLDKIKKDLELLNSIPAEEIYNDEFWKKVERNLMAEQKERRLDKDFNTLRTF